MASQTTTKVAAGTGAAKDDVLPSAVTGLDEDNSYAALAVLANDPGAARLYSLAQDLSGLAGTAQFPIAASAVLPSGALITINPDGTIGYDAAGAGAALQACAEGDFFTDSFVYTVRMANGALSTARVTLAIAGVNDAPTLAGAAPVALLDTADDDTPAPVTGKLGGADVDHAAVLAYSLLGGGLAAGTVYGTLVLDPATGAYSFAADPDQIDALGAGMTASASFTVQVKDEHGAASAPVVLMFNLVGANDSASISGTGSGSVGEDATLAVTGSLAVQDRDTGEAVFAAPASLSGTYGDFSFDVQTGQWTYALRNADANVQALGAGKVVSDDIVVTSLDGTASASLHVEIAGANDAASLGGAATGELTEDGTLTAGGMLTVQDLDAGEAKFLAAASLTGTYGDFTFDEQTGQWTYALRNADTNVQALGAGKIVTDGIVVTSLDGTASASLHVEITGANDAASIGGAATGAVTEDGTLTASGVLTVHDIDAGEAIFRAPASLAGTYGDFTFDQLTGQWGYALRNGDANVQALGAGKVVVDDIVVTSLDGTASASLHVEIAGANDAASIGGAATGAVTEDGTLTASGVLTVHDIDAGEAIFRAPASLAGTYGDFTFDQLTGQWGYALHNGEANVQALGAGKVVADEIVVTSLDGSTSASLHVEITGVNDAASIGGAATGAVAEDGTLSADGVLTVQDLDAGEAKFLAAASLAGTYGDFTFDEQTGQWTYALRNADTNVQALVAGKIVADDIVVTSLDGTASASLHVEITGANDVASIGGAATGAVAEDGTLTAGGVLTVQDADAGEAGFRAPASLAGTYGNFSFDTSTGAWSYALRNGDAAVQALATGQQVVDQLIVASLDGSASQTIRVNVAGADETASANPVRIFQVNRGQADSNDRIYYSGFDDNDLLAYANNLNYVGRGLADTNGDGVADASTATFEFANNGGKLAHIVVVLVGYTGLTDAQVGH